MWLGCSCDVREEVLPVFFLGCGAAEPLLEMRRAEARVIAGGKALIVQLCAEVEGVDVRGHLPWVSRCAQETPGRIHPFGLVGDRQSRLYRLMARQLRRQ